jgi:hypothetical protein
LRRRLLRIVLNFGIASLSIAAGLALLEVAAGLLPPPFQGPEPSAEVCDGAFGWRGRPGYETPVVTEGYAHTLTLNDSGHHDTDHPLAKPADTYRILLLGDSFARAHQVPESETSHQVLEDWLNANAAPPRFEVINAGVDAWGTAQELLYYRQEGRLYQPDMVLLLLYLANDVKDNLPGRGLTLGERNCYAPYFTLCADGELDPSAWRHAPGLAPVMGECPAWRRALADALAWLYDHSNLYRRLEPLLLLDLPEVSALSFYETDNATFDYGLTLTLALVGQMAQEVEADGVAFGVVLISPEDLITFLQMSDAEREAVYERLPLLRSAANMPSPNEMVAESLAAQGIRVLDLLPPFAQEMERGDALLYFAGDRHWNVAGNRLAGEEMGRWIVGQDLPQR